MWSSIWGTHVFYVLQCLQKNFKATTIELNCTERVMPMTAKTLMWVLVVSTIVDHFTSVFCRRPTSTAFLAHKMANSVTCILHHLPQHIRTLPAAWKDPINRRDTTTVRLCITQHAIILRAPDSISDTGHGYKVHKMCWMLALFYGCNKNMRT